MTDKYVVKINKPSDPDKPFSIFGNLQGLDCAVIGDAYGLSVNDYLDGYHLIKRH